MTTLRPFVGLIFVALSACSAKPLVSIPPESGGYGRLILHVRIPHERQPRRRSHFVPGLAKSISITLNEVNGEPPPARVVRTAKSALSDCSSGCSVVGPAAPPGSDNFTVSIFGGPLGTPGPALSTATATFAIVAGKANAASITLNGVPAKFALHKPMPSASGGTALAVTALPIDVEDADGDVITGTYSTPVTLSDSDGSSLTACGGLCGSAIQLGSGTGTKRVVLANSMASADVTIRYGGMDIVPAALTASTSSGPLVSVGSVTFSPTVAPISYVGPLNGSAPEIVLGVMGPTTTLTKNFTDSQSGWTNAPYDQTIGEGDNCNSGGNAIATYAQNAVTNGTAWTVTVVGSPVVGTCTATLHGGAGAALAITTKYVFAP